MLHIAPDMRALVTGAGGFLGLALVRALAARGDAVRALVRRPSPALSAAGAEVVIGDATEPRAARTAVTGCEVVFHLAGLRRARDPAEFLRVNAGGTRVVLEAALEVAPRLSRFVLAGSLAAAGPSRTPLAEDAPLRPVEPYGVSKAEAERIALAFAERLPVAVARPPRIVGPGDRENLLFFRIAARGLALDLGDRPLSFIDVDDCARGLLLLADRPEARGEAFFLASEERTTALALMTEAARALGVRAHRVPLPAPLLRGVARVNDALSSATGRRLPISRKLAAQVLAPGWACDPAKARARLGFEARTSLRESVSRSAAWYLAERWL